MRTAAKRARIGDDIKLLCDRFPHTFSLQDPQPLKIVVHAELVVTLGDAVPAPDLQFALRPTRALPATCADCQRGRAASVLTARWETP